MEETWKLLNNVVEKGDKYSISTIGNVRNNVTGKVLKHHIMPKGYHTVALCQNGKAKNYLVHRLIALAFIPNPENKSEVDHIDIHKDNNTLFNLRWANHAQSQLNIHKKPGCSSKYKGVTWCKREKRWYASIKKDGKNKHLGIFDDEIQAAKCWDAHIYSEFQTPNFPK